MEKMCNTPCNILYECVSKILNDQEKPTVSMHRNDWALEKPTESTGSGNTVTEAKQTPSRTVRLQNGKRVNCQEQGAAFEQGAEF